ncbi:hypothetical protein CRENBAI_016744 [Crenichthys baileyi]|uniref:Ig-like domain-containing protein n=1 Tax=Crenichthys baileyi TaxID=28760 RepID=A0AAV9QTR2_9TELE
MIWTLLLLFVGGVFSNQCSVEYRQPHMCAVRGSSVIFFCFFNNIKKQEVKRFAWSHARSSKTYYILSHSQNVFKRFEYTGDKEHNCSMKIHKVELIDAGKYLFRYNNNKRCLTKHLSLSIVDLNILVQSSSGDAIKEGDSVNLTCINGCDDEDASSLFTWFKDGEAINEGPVLHLSNVSSKHSGNYTCSLKNQKGTTSGVARVDVEYGPKNTSVLMRSSKTVVLICCSDAQPPVQNYSWFKIVDGQMLKVGHQVEMLPVQGVATTIIAVCRLTKKKKRAQKAEHQEEIQRTDNVNRLMCDDSRRSQAVIDLQVEETTAEIIYASIDFRKTRRSNPKQQDYQSETVIYSTVCREQLLNRSNRASS